MAVAKVVVSASSAAEPSLGPLLHHSERVPQRNGAPGKALSSHARDSPVAGVKEKTRMKAVLPLLCIALTACDGKSARAPNGSIARALQRGMTEQQVAEVISSNRVPDRVVMSTCGMETPKPFACKVYVYEGGLRAGRYDPKLSVVFEDVRGHWIVTQWL
jgi:hypothetical protein